MVRQHAAEVQELSDIIAAVEVRAIIISQKHVVLPEVYAAVFENAYAGKN